MDDQNLNAEKPVVVLLGSGRVATLMGQQFREAGLPVAKVVSRTAAHARALGEALGIPWATRPDETLKRANWIILAVRDDAIVAVAQQLAPFAGNALVTHTSGATPGKILAPYFQRFGVFYPLQTFSEDSRLDWTQIPVCIDANSEPDRFFLKTMVQTLGARPYEANDEQRSYLHIAAVFANNFANHCMVIAEKLLAQHNLSFEMLHPLMSETFQKALSGSPFQAQTGPAVRGDTETIRRHIKLLETQPEWQIIYQQITENIQTLR